MLKKREEEKLSGFVNYIEMLKTLNWFKNKVKISESQLKQLSNQQNSKSNLNNFMTTLLMKISS